MIGFFLLMNSNVVSVIFKMVISKNEENGS